MKHVWDLATKMLLEGKSFKDISLTLGIPVNTIYMHFVRCSRQPHRSVYKGFDNFFRQSNTNRTDMAKNIFGPTHKDYQKLANILTGKTKHVQIDVIKKLLKYTGMTFEELFKTEEEIES